MSKFINSIREAEKKDAQYIFNMDLKGFDNVWSAEKWTALSENPNAKVWVGCYRTTPISFMASEQRTFVPPGQEENAGTMHIHKVCVKETFRRRGIGVKLLSYAHQEAVKAGIKWITMSVPAWFVEDDHPCNCLGWLSKYNFTALTVLAQKVEMYGCSYDQYLFGYKLK